MSRSLASGFLSIAGARIAILLAGVIFTPLLVRFLGPSSYGRYAVILSVFAVANFVMGSGTNDAIRKFISENDDLEWQTAVFGKIGQIALALALLISFSFLAGAVTGIVERVFGTGFVALFYLLAIYAISRQSFDFLLRTLMGLQLETYSEPIKVFQRFLFVATALSAAYLGYDVAGVMIAHILATAVASLLALFALTKYLDIGAILSTSSVQLPRNSIYRYTVSTMFYFGLLMSLYHVDILILQQYEREQIVGYYKGSLMIAETLWIIPGSLQLALLQRMSNHWDEGNLTLIQQRATITTRFSLGFTVLVVMGVAALADAFVPLYLGEEFRPSILPLLLLLPGVVGFATARPSLAINQAQRSLRPLILATGACAAINLGLNLLLIPRYGMAGAAIATSIGYGSLVIFQALAARLLGYSLFADVRFLRIILVALLSAGPIFGLAWLLPPLVSLAVVPIVGFALYSVGTIALGVFSPDEVDPILSKLPARYETKMRSIITLIPKI
ncbi:polysaccharide biosynthesis C-terminal domain-containing protein [Natronomonas salina]|uniref:lipopolysaccharide biosynthesis protein n=1 Tax=Natronomonas salina TaxID=1710540 RepID=UPI0015B66C3C|nr:polysaccharide biosynthesis C-terminal domain-containing protein [Natronomonas salina]QLD88783.1 polysaccharide biosynthesis C-terminal domain-containing protein [Natronomonas salina]